MVDIKSLILTHPNGEGQKKEYTMSISTAEKMLNCRTTSKKWEFKNDKIKFVKTRHKDSGKEIGKIVFPSN